MKSYELAELYLNTDGINGEKELREYIANGGDINERDADGMSALDIARATEYQSKSQKLIAPRLVEIIESLGGI